MRAYFIGLDIGTSSVKAVAFDENGAVLGKKSIAYPTLSPRPGYQEQVPETIVKNTFACLKKLLAEMTGSPACIALSSAMHSLLAIDKNDKPVTNSILWSDNRSAAMAGTLKGTPLGDAIYHHTGTPIHAMSPLCKIAWLKQHEPSVFQKTARFVGVKEYLVYNLTGQWLTDISIASATGLFDAVEGNWFPPALEFAGIGQDQLPRLVPADFIIGPIRPALAAELRLPPDIPFVIGGSDGCLANLGAGAAQSGEAVLTIGTSGALRMNHVAPVPDPQQRIFNYFLLKGLFVTGGASNNGGLVYEWFARQFFGTGPGASRMAARQAATGRIPAGSEGLLFLPYLTGERAPIWNAHATGAFLGIAKRHTRAHFHKAVLEGILLNISMIGEVLEAVAGPIGDIYANGGFANMPAWLQMAADVFGKRIIVSENGEASAFGAALLGMKTLGFIQDFSLAKTAAKASQSYLPVKDKHEIYLEKRKAMQETYAKINA